VTRDTDTLRRHPACSSGYPSESTTVDAADLKAFVQYWRREADHALARRVLDGDIEALSRRLAAYEGLDEQQLGLLKALPDEATSPARVHQLHSIWKLLYDRLLPAVRQLGSNDSRRDRINWREVKEFDEALLLTPGDHVTDWPWTETLTIATHWFAAYEARPTVADRRSSSLRGYWA
jgi:hypothetical protein